MMTGRLPDSSDIGTLVGDGSFSDADDSNSWMQKIDVTGFKELTVVEPSQSCKSLKTPLPAYHSPSSYSGGDSSLSSPPAKKGRPDSLSCEPDSSSSGRSYPKPTYSYSCLIALALKNSKAGRLTVSEIYNFMCENFPYFRAAPAGWKNSVRHNLSLNKCFEKIEIESPAGQGRKACLWTMNPNRIHKMDQEIMKWREKDPHGVIDSLVHPEELELIENGLKGMPGDSNPYLLQKLPDLIQHTHHAAYFPRSLSDQPAMPNRYGQPMMVACGPQDYSNQLYQQHLPTKPWPPLQLAQFHSSQPNVPFTPRTPPKVYPQMTSDTMMLSPCQGQMRGSPAPGFSTPVANTHHSPYAHTPPLYSPNLNSPQVRQLTADWSSRSPGFAARFACPSVKSDSTLDGPSDYFAPFTSSSAFSLNYVTSTTGPDNNNSLLLNALSQSPCRTGNTTVLQSL